ncbi:hypothetical protein GQ54DRAFT_300147 [Martensiomyces pterosporus]|nr:hypothetical protein GQ54DRAFT_300147 [Martensiomyces pterosporus]
MALYSPCFLHSRNGSGGGSAFLPSLCSRRSPTFKVTPMKLPYTTPIHLALVGVCRALNYTGETALLDAAPALPNHRHATSVTFGELGAFDFRGDGRARVALQLGAFSSEKDGTATGGSPAAKAAAPNNNSGSALLHRMISSALNPGGMFLGASPQGGGATESRPTRDTDPIELDHVYLIFAKSRAVNNFVARLHTLRRSDASAAVALCTNVSNWLDSEFVAPITSLRRPPPVKKEEEEAAGAKVTSDGQVFSSAYGSAASLSDDKSNSRSVAADDGRLKISFISATGPTAPVDLAPRPTRVTGIQKRALATPHATPSSSLAAAPTDGPLLGSEPKPNDVFLVEYEWEWQVKHGGEYAVVIANCAATTIQFKYNLIMANRWHDGQWTNLPAGWMPVQQVYPAVCYTLWSLAAGLWVIVQLRHRSSVKPVLGVVLGFVPLLRFMSCLADQSRYNLWGNGSYEVTMIVVSTSLVDALADGAQFLVVLALGKGWGVVRARLVGTEKRLVSGLVIFIGVATLYDGATRGGGVLAVGVMQMVAVVYAWASLAHTRRVHAVQTLRLVSRNEPALTEWWSRTHGSHPQVQVAEHQSADAVGESPAAHALFHLSRRSWSQVSGECNGCKRHLTAMALLWSAVRKERLLSLAYFSVLPLQALDLVVLFVSNFAVPPHYAFVGLLLAQAAHWVAYMAMFVGLVAGGLELPDVGLPAIPAIATRRSIPLPPAGAAAMSPRPLPPLGRLRLFSRAAPFGTAPA